MKNENIKMIEPIEGLKLYFNVNDRGPYSTTRELGNICWIMHEGVSMDQYQKAMCDGKAKSKMTKNEAVETVMLTMQKGQNDADQFVKCLMALGVLKVEEEIKEKDNRIVEIENINYGYSSTRISKAIEALQKAGYRIDKR